MSEQKTTQQPEQELSEQRRVRREKLAALFADALKGYGLEVQEVADPVRLGRHLCTDQGAL